MIEMGEIRFVIGDKLHHSLKLKAVKEKKTLKGLVIELLEEGIKK